MLFRDNYRHTVMYRLQQFICRGSDYRTGREESCSPSGDLHDAVETGKAEGLAILKIYEEGRHGVV